MNASWSDLLSMLTLSASLNFGFAAFSYIRQIAFGPEVGALKQNFDRIKALQKDQAVYRSKKIEIDTIYNNLVRLNATYSNVELTDYSISGRFIILNILCGFIATVLIFKGAYFAGESAGRAESLISAGTNIGWLLFLISIIFAVRKLHKEVRLPRLTLSREIAKLEDL